MKFVAPKPGKEQGEEIVEMDKLFQPKCKHDLYTFKERYGHSGPYTQVEGCRKCEYRKVIGKIGC